MSDVNMLLAADWLIGIRCANINVTLQKTARGNESLVSSLQEKKQERGEREIEREEREREAVA